MTLMEAARRVVRDFDDRGNMDGSIGQLERALLESVTPYTIALDALTSISNNSCCGDCQEAKRVARNALTAIRKATT